MPHCLFFRLRVPGLAEKRPSVILGDKIRVKPHGSNGKWHAGYVHHVELEHVSLQFHHSFVGLKNQKFDVRFTLGRTPLRRMHAGLSVAWNPARLLFPAQEHIQDCVAPSADEISAVRLFNRTLETNPSQKLAVTSILCQPPGGVPFVVFGPYAVSFRLQVLIVIERLAFSDQVQVKPLWWSKLCVRSSTRIPALAFLPVLRATQRPIL